MARAAEHAACRLCTTMRILLLGAYPPPHGGVQSHILALCRYLKEQGVPYKVINLTRHRRPDSDEVYYPHSAAQVVRLLFRLPYDVAHLHVGGDLSQRLLALGLVCCSVPGRATVFTFHSGGYPSSPQGRRAHPRTFRGFVLRRFDRLIGVNQEIIDFYQRCGVPKQRLRLILPYAPVRIPPGTMLPPEMEMFFRSHDPVLLSVSGLEPEYDLPQQFRALGLVRQNFPQAGLAIVGSGSLEYELRRMISEQPGGEHILLCGDVPHDATLLAIQRASLLLRTTLYDGDAISIREALQLGTPVIATDNSMRPEGVILIPPSNLEALHAEIEACLRKKRCANPPPAISSGEENMAAVLALYQELLRR